MQMKGDKCEYERNEVNAKQIFLEGVTLVLRHSNSKGRLHCFIITKLMEILYF